MNNGACLDSLNEHSASSASAADSTTTSHASPRSQSCSPTSLSSDEDANCSAVNGHSLKVLLKSPFSAKLGLTKYSPIQSCDD